MSVHELHDRMQHGQLKVLDVRREPEWQAGHLAEAAWFTLDKFKTELPAMDENLPLAVHCKSGYRSMIACSLLQRAGYRNIINVTGGFDAWQQAGLPIASGATVGA
jgi:hydroxyacylglutathione hydrolase